MREIFEAQDALNDHILNKIGVSWEEVKQDEFMTGQWIRKYAEAFQAEYVEFLEESRKSPHGNMARVEVIDMVHFLVSLSILTGITSDEAESAVETDHRFDRFISNEVLHALDKIHTSIPWRWWQKGGHNSKALASRGTLDLWNIISVIMSIIGMSSSDLKAMYFAKNRVNYERQKNGYSADTKTEDDNLAICEEFGK